MDAVLSIDTAGPVVGAALVTAAGALCWSARVSRGADGLLLPALGALLDGRRGEVDGQWTGERCPGARLTLLAVAVGPGAFTGLRVGVSAALGLAVARGLPVAPVSSLAARAAQVPGRSRVLAALDARKERLYAGLFDCTGALPQALGPEVDAPPAEVWPAAPFVAVGEGALLHEAEIRLRGGELAPDCDAVPVVALARLGLLGGQRLDPGLVALRYLRPPDARPPAGLAPLTQPPEVGAD